MKKRNTLLFFLLILASALLIGYLTLFTFDEKDRKDYFSLMEKADPSQAAKENPYTATQKHHNVHKEIWYNKKNGEKNQRLQLVLRGKDADLILEHDNAKTEVVEHMKNVHCLMQEELFEIQGKPMQLIRYIEADNATYSYDTNCLKATEVTILRFQVPGHTLIQSTAGLKPIMKGKAKEVEFSMGSEDLNFKAHQMKATWYDE